MIFKKMITGIILFSSLMMAQKAPLWQKDLGEPIKEYNFINSEKYLFFTSGEYVWCNDVETGKEIWQMEVPDFEKEGISYLLGELFLTNSDNKLQAYDALSGKMLWEKSYDDIDQSDYKMIEFIKNNAVFDYGDYELGIDLNNGNELFRMEIEYWGKLVELGSFNYSVLSQQDKMFVMEDEKAVLIDVKNGKRVFEKEGYDINTDLIENKLPWLYQSPGNEYLLTILDKGAAVIDVRNNKELARSEFSIDGDINVLLPTAQGCAVMGEEKFVHFNFKNGEINEFMFPIDEIRTMHAYRTSDKDILIVSMEDQIASIDLIGGKVLWMSKKEDPEFEGYAHRYLKNDGKNIILTYVRGTLFSEENGTYVYIMSIDGVSGKVNYKIPVLLSQAVMTDFTRALSKTIVGAFSAFVTAASMGVGADASGQAMDMVNDMMGYSNIGFEYQNFDYGDGNIVFFSGGSNVNYMNYPMWDPSTRKEPGEGFVSVNYKTGQVNYKTYFPISAEMDGRKVENQAPLNIQNNIAYKAGNEKVIAFNLDSGKKIWETKIPDKHIREITEINDMVYVRYGVQVIDVKLKEKQVELHGQFSEDPFGFIGIDKESGKILWDSQCLSDPMLLTPEFTIDRYFDDQSNVMYFADMENLYSLKMGKDGGKFAWKMNFEDSGMGEFDYGESFAITEKWIGSVPRSRSTSTYLGGGWVMTTKSTSGGYNDEAVSDFIDDAADADLSTTYRSWGNIWGVSAKKCLRVLYGKDKIVIFGPDKMALVDALSGKIEWKKEWDFDKENVQYIPQILNGNIVYCMDENLVLVDLNTGKEIYQAEIDDKSKFFTSPDKKKLFNLYDEKIAGFSLGSK